MGVSVLYGAGWCVLLGFLGYSLQATRHEKCVYDGTAFGGSG